jgi:iron(III) transport system ATP-binding protein
MDETDNSFYAKVEKTEFLGPYTLVTMHTSCKSRSTVLAQFSSNYLEGRPIHAGSTLRLAIPPEHFYPMQSAS